MSFSKLITSKLLFAAPMAIALLSACVPQDGPYPPPIPAPIGGDMCTMDYAPVCGESRGQTRTFSNVCAARKAGYRVKSPGECRIEDDREPRFCSQDYAPVCAQRRGQMRTFPNSCTAGEEGFRVLSSGECRRQDDRDEEAFCTQDYAPVCGLRDGSFRTYSNSCSAKADGAAVASAGSCI